MAVYGFGSLAGSALVMAWPLRGDSDRLTPVLALVVAASLAVVIVVPGLVTSLVAFGLAGIANSLFFAATLAARSEYAPVEGPRAGIHLGGRAEDRRRVRRHRCGRSTHRGDVAADRRRRRADSCVRHGLCRRAKASEPALSAPHIQRLVCAATRSNSDLTSSVNDALRYMLLL